MKAIQAIKEIRKRENFHWEKAVFCKDHNMVLDEMKHRAIEDELRRLANKLSDILETGYVSVQVDDITSESEEKD